MFIAKNEILAIFDIYEAIIKKIIKNLLAILYL